MERGEVEYSRMTVHGMDFMTYGGAYDGSEAAFVRRYLGYTCEQILYPEPAPANASVTDGDDSGSREVAPRDDGNAGEEEENVEGARPD